MPRIRWHISTAGVAIAAALLAACSVPNGLPFTMGERPAPMALEGSPPTGQMAHLENVKIIRPTDLDATKPDTETKLAAVPLPQLKPRSDLVDLVGYSEGEALALLGRPQRKEEEPPAKVWRYVNNSCVVDVYFYLDVSRNTFHVLHYAAPDDALPEALVQQCLRSVRDANLKL